MGSCVVDLYDKMYFCLILYKSWKHTRALVYNKPYVQKYRTETDTSGQVEYTKATGECH